MENLNENVEMLLGIREEECIAFEAKKLAKERVETNTQKVLDDIHMLFGVKSTIATLKVKNKVLLGLILIALTAFISLVLKEVNVSSELLGAFEGFDELSVIITGCAFTATFLFTVVYMIIKHGSNRIVINQYEERLNLYNNDLLRKIELLEKYEDNLKDLAEKVYSKIEKDELSQEEKDLFNFISSHSAKDMKNESSINNENELMILNNILTFWKTRSGYDYSLDYLVKCVQSSENNFQYKKFVNSNITDLTIKVNQLGWAN